MNVYLFCLNHYYNNDLDGIKSHIGMIVYSSTLDTMEKVISTYGGTTWVRIENKFLIGAGGSYGIGTSGGSSTCTLTSSNLPSHNHTVSAFNSGNNSSNHTHSIPSLSGSTSEQPNHTHYLAHGGYPGSGSYGWSLADNIKVGGTETTQGAGKHTHTLTTTASTTGAQSANHNHSIPAHNTNSTGSGTAFSILNPYKAVYIWERTA